MRIHHITPRKHPSQLVVLLCLTVSAAEASGQCAVTPIPVGDGTARNYNSPVDLDGDIAVIADVSNEPCCTLTGSVEVRRFDGSVWVTETILTASNGAEGNVFGNRVAVSGNVIAIGAPAWNTPANDGAVYIFRYNITTMVWEEEAILTQQLAGVGTAFGSNLALDGNVVAIHGSMLNGLGENINGAHVFRYNPSTLIWEFEQAVTIDDPLVGAWLPNNWMALDGDVLIAGEPTVIFGEKGAARIYRFDGATWNLDVKISSPTTTSEGFDLFGIAVDVLGNMAVIGLFIDSDLPSGSTVGAVYVYEYDGANWNFTQKVVPVNPEPIESNGFGRAVSLADDVLLVGDTNADEPITMAASAGAVYRFKRVGAAWEEQGIMFAPDAMTGDFFSLHGVAISGDRAIISSDRRGDVTGNGSAYIVEGVRGIGGPDCNNNGVADYCDILDFTSADTNTNDIPDECECLADTDGSGVVNVTDLLSLLSGWGPNPGHPADINNDGTVNVFDLLALLAAWGACP